MTIRMKSKKIQNEIIIPNNYDFDIMKFVMDWIIADTIEKITREDW